jgi:hypothetical protein
MAKKYIIVGLGRSGTTIIGKKISEHLGAVFAGELIYLGSRGFENISLCGCGRYQSDCEFWKPIQNYLTPNELIHLKAAEDNLRLKYIFRLRSQKKFQTVFKKVHDKLSSERPIVDTSKIFPYALMFRSLNDYEFIHVIRDPVAVTASMMSPKYIHDIGKVGYLHNGGLVRTPIRWVLINNLVKLLLPISHTIKYEEFVSDPQKILDKIGSKKDGAVSNHSVAGNPARFDSTEIKKQKNRKQFNLIQMIVIKTISVFFRYKS